MPMKSEIVGKDADGNDVVMVWGDDLNWAHGFVEGPSRQQKEYYRAQGRGGAHYVVSRDLATRLDNKNKPIFNYWYATMHVDGKTTHLSTEFMSAYEGQEICQIFESERDTRAHELKNALARIESKIKGE